MGCKATVSETISHLRASGYPQDQAQAIAMDCVRRGKTTRKRLDPEKLDLICKVQGINQEKRLVTVVTNRVSKADGTPYVDHDGDVMDIGNLEDVFIKSFFDDGMAKGGGGEMHERDGGVDVVQWFTLSQDERLALGFGPGDEMGIAKLRVNDDEIWKRVKAGYYPEVSIEGVGTREAYYG